MGPVTAPPGSAATMVVLALLVVLAVVLALIVAHLLHRDPVRSGPVVATGAPRADDGGPAVDALVPTSGVPAAPRPVRILLAGPPTIEGATLRDWLVHHARRDRVWEDVVVEFYRRAAADPSVAAYFTGVDLAALQRHFLATLTMLTHTGLHRHTVDRMATAHRAVRTPDGVPVTGRVWDAVVSALVGALAGHGVPASTIESLGALLDPLRAVIVVEP